MTASRSAGFDGGFESRKSSTGSTIPRPKKMKPDPIGEIAAELAVGTSQPGRQVSDGVITLAVGIAQRWTGRVFRPQGLSGPGLNELSVTLEVNQLRRR